MAKDEDAVPQTVPVVRIIKDVDYLKLFERWFFNTTALAAAITFGIFSVLSWVVADNAREQANTANVLALAALCASVAHEESKYNGEVQSFCSQLFPKAWPALAGAVSKIFPDISSVHTPSASSGASSGPPSSTSSSSFSSSASTKPAHHNTRSTAYQSSTIYQNTTTLQSSTIAHNSPKPPSTTPDAGHLNTTNPYTSTVYQSSTNAQGSNGTQFTFTATRTTSTSSSAYTYYDGGGPSSSSSPNNSGGLTTGAKIGLGVGFAIGIPVVFVTALTYLRYRKLRREKVI